MAAVCSGLNESALEKPGSKRRTVTEHQSLGGLESQLSRVDQARVVITQPLTRKMNTLLRTVGVQWSRQSFVVPARKEPA